MALFLRLIVIWFVLLCSVEAGALAILALVLWDGAWLFMFELDAWNWGDYVKRPNVKKPKSKITNTKGRIIKGQIPKSRKTKKKICDQNK